MFTFFHPGRTFPSISVTGNRCELNCLHCGHHYLSAMEPVTEPRALRTRLRELAELGGSGALISGGCTRDGVVPLDPFIPVLADIKRETNLRLNVHTGFIHRNGAEALSRAGVDMVSLDIVGSRETVQTIYGLDRGPGDYRLTLSRLVDAGIPGIVPHITVGLHRGRLYGEYNAVRILSQSCTPDAVVINVMIPTRDTPMEEAPVVSDSNVIRIIEYTLTLVDAPVYLGCMRPKGNVALELAAEEAGVSGIVLPSTEARREIGLRRTTQVVNTCCALVPRPGESGN